MSERKCDGCTKCCEGWLSGVAHCKNFYKGMPCHFMAETGCSIYENRPQDPCKNFQCEWLVNLEIPEWMKPNRVNVIATKRKIDNYEYLELTEAGEKLKVEVLNWFILYALNNHLNLVYSINGGINKVGCLEFLNHVKGKL